LTIEFKDYFSQSSDAYHSYRPGYPDDLFSYLSSITNSNELAWDCATGSGQSALALSNHFSEVIGTDASKNQIENAKSKDGVTYKVEAAEKTSLKNNSVDLITVAQALHWFDIDAFSAEVLRVLKSQGVLAVWTYGLLNINPQINNIINHLYGSMLDQYWPPERKIVEQGYKNIQFPLQKIEAPLFQMETNWDLSQLIGYLCTWSAVKKYEADKGVNPVEEKHEKIAGLWGDPQQKLLVQWPLTLKLWVKQ